MNVTEQVICSPFIVRYSEEVVREFYVMNLTIVVLNSLLCIGITLGNVVLLVSILSTPSLRTPSFLLVSSLASTDLGVGLFVQPLYVWRKVEEMRGNTETLCALYIAGNVLAHLIGSPSFFTATALSADRYLAISLGMRYRQIVSNKRVIRLIVGLWLSAGFVVLARFYCRKPKYMSIPAALLFLCLLVMCTCYMKAIRLLRNHTMNARKGKGESSTAKIVKFKHSLITMFLVVVTLFACYLPFICVHISGSVSSAMHAQDHRRAREFTTTLLFANSLLTPTIYFSRSKELRRAFRQVLVKLGCRRLMPTAVQTADLSTDGRLTMVKELSPKHCTRRLLSPKFQDSSV